jgi:HEAT repeat protein
MSYFRDRLHDFERRPYLIAAAGVLIVAMLVALIAWRLQLGDAPHSGDQSELADLTLEDLKNRLTFKAHADIDYMDRILTHPEALAYAAQLLASGAESDRYVGLMIYANTPELLGLSLSETDIALIREALEDISPAIRTYAGYALLNNREYTGVPVLIGQIGNPLPLTFMEPLVTQDRFVRDLLAKAFNENFDGDEAAAEAAWTDWWETHRGPYESRRN